jgi:hypothetical protein
MESARDSHMVDRVREEYEPPRTLYLSPGEYEQRRRAPANCVHRPGKRCAHRLQQRLWCVGLLCRDREHRGDLRRARQRWRSAAVGTWTVCETCTQAALYLAR